VSSLLIDDSKRQAAVVDVDKIIMRKRITYMIEADEPLRGQYKRLQVHASQHRTLNPLLL